MPNVVSRRMRAGSVLLALLLGFSVVAVGARPAFACSCAGGESAEEAFQRADAVFSGEMVRGGMEDPAPEDDTTIGGIRFRVIEAWKGVSGGSVMLYGQEAAYYGELEEGEMGVSGGCAYAFVQNERYLVYASRYEDGLQTGLCDRTAPLAEAGNDLDALGPPAGVLPETGGPPLPPPGGVPLEHTERETGPALAAAAAVLASLAVGVFVAVRSGRSPGR